MKANQNKCNYNCTLITAALVAIGAVVISALPISANAIADENGAGNGKTLNNGLIRQSAVARSHASANSAVGILAIYKHAFDGKNEVSQNRAKFLGNQIAAMKMDLTNPHLLDGKRKLIQQNLSIANDELAEIIRKQESAAEPSRHIAERGVATNLKANLFRFFGIYLDQEIDQEIDMAVAGGRPD